MTMHDVEVDWNGRWYSFNCSCGKGHGGFITEHRAKMAMRRHVAWYSRQSKVDEGEPTEPDVDVETSATQPAGPATIIMPVVRDAQPANPHRRMSHDLEDTEEL